MEINMTTMTTYQFYNERVIEGAMPVHQLLAVAHSFEAFARSQGVSDEVPPFRYSTSTNRVFIDLHATHAGWDGVSFDPHAFHAWAQRNSVDLFD